MGKIVAITGSAGSGKDSLANIVIKNSKEKWVKLSFASHLKDVVALLFGFDRAMLEGDTVEHRVLRETPDKFWSEKMGKDFTPRQALQIVGTDLLRNQLHQNIWVDCLEQKMQNMDCNILITDCRFKNEIEMLKKMDATFVRMEFEEKPNYWQPALFYNYAYGTPLVLNDWITLQPFAEELEKKFEYGSIDKNVLLMLANSTIITNKLINVHISEWDWIGYDRPDYTFIHQDTIEDLEREVIGSDFWSWIHDKKE